MIVMLLLFTAWDAPGMIQDKKWKDLTVFLLIVFLAIMASTILALGANPDLYGFLKGILKSFR